MTIEDIIEDNNIKSYYCLQPWGTFGYAFPKVEALKVIDALKENFYIILGGDAYILDGDEISLTYENWFCPSGENECPYDYLKRSCAMAIQFIHERDEYDNYLYNFVFAPMDNYRIL